MWSEMMEEEDGDGEEVGDVRRRVFWTSHFTRNPSGLLK